MRIFKEIEADETRFEVDLTFLDPDEKLLWKTNSWKYYLLIFQESLRTLIVTNLVALILSIAWIMLAILYITPFSEMGLIIGVILIIFSVNSLVYLLSFLFIPFHQFRFIPIMKYKKRYQIDELCPYKWFYVITEKRLINKQIENSFKKWNEYQLSHLTITKDRISCDFSTIHAIDIYPGLFGEYTVNINGPTVTKDFPSEVKKSKISHKDEKKDANINQKLISFCVNSEEITKIIPILYNLQKEHAFTITFNSIHDRILLAIFFVAAIFISLIGIFV